MSRNMYGYESSKMKSTPRYQDCRVKGKSKRKQPSTVECTTDAPRNGDTTRYVVVENRHAPRNEDESKRDSSWR